MFVHGQWVGQTSVRFSHVQVVWFHIWLHDIWCSIVYRARLSRVHNPSCSFWGCTSFSQSSDERCSDYNQMKIIKNSVSIRNTLKDLSPIVRCSLGESECDSFATSRFHVLRPLRCVFEGVASEFGWSHVHLLLACGSLLRGRPLFTFALYPDCAMSHSQVARV